MSTPNRKRTVDYIKFVWRGGHDVFQSYTLPHMDRLSEAAERRGINSLQVKYTVLGGNKMHNDERRITEAWGSFAHYLFYNVPTNWLNAVYRLDIRETLPTVTSDQVSAIQTAIALGAKPKVNVVAFNTKPRHKTNSRDIGGVGITIGSRKSDHHGVVYARGTEEAALEYRVQNKKINRLMKELYTMWQDDQVYDLREHVISELLVSRENFLQKAIGVETVKELAEFAANAERRVQAMQNSASWAESIAEREYWQSLSEEEQKEYQEAVWFPVKPA